MKKLIASSLVILILILTGCKTADPIVECQSDPTADTSVSQTIQKIPWMTPSSEKRTLNSHLQSRNPRPIPQKNLPRNLRRRRGLLKTGPPKPHPRQAKTNPKMPRNRLRERNHRKPTLLGRNRRNLPRKLLLLRKRSLLLLRNQKQNLRKRSHLPRKLPLSRNLRILHSRKSPTSSNGRLLPMQRSISMPTEAAPARYCPV